MEMVLVMVELPLLALITDFVATIVEVEVLDVVRFAEISFDTDATVTDDAVDVFTTFFDAAGLPIAADVDAAGLLSVVVAEALTDEAEGFFTAAADEAGTPMPLTIVGIVADDD